MCRNNNHFFCGIPKSLKEKPGNHEIAHLYCLLHLHLKEIPVRSKKASKTLLLPCFSCSSSALFANVLYSYIKPFLQWYSTNHLCLMGSIKGTCCEKSLFSLRWIITFGGIRGWVGLGLGYLRWIVPVYIWDNETVWKRG